MECSSNKAPGRRGLVGRRDGMMVLGLGDRRPDQTLGVLVEVGRAVVVAERRTDHARFAAATRAHVREVDGQQPMEGGRASGQHNPMHMKANAADHQHQIGVQLGIVHGRQVFAVRAADDGDLWRWRLGRPEGRLAINI